MKLPDQGCLLKIIVGEALRYQGMPLYEWIVIEARKQGIAGATVYRGIMGFGANSRIKTNSVLRLSNDMPVVIEMIDEAQKLEKLLDTIDPAISEGIVTLQDLAIRMYRHRK
ncbi:DUF190 domain-containing protein [Desulfogranum japonicum]|uniref:DUF190 domain-containing protein n=1 Tax=Desulfogranum japonicum TaxID=231447 RepID=UPI00040545FD|nr:DUF190 domain-containing protein [Desulfogranum japonicum]